MGGARTLVADLPSAAHPAQPTRTDTDDRIMGATTSMTTLVPAARTRLPVAVYVRGAGPFPGGTSELRVAGPLPQAARDFDISTPQAGLMTTVFAIGSIIGPPVTILFTLRLPRR